MRIERLLGKTTLAAVNAPLLPLVVAYGAGVDSTAMLVGMHRLGIRPDLILFADTGGEKPETYAYIRSVVQPWLVSVGFPPVITVRYLPVRVQYMTLEGNCLDNKTLPSLAFGYKKCSLKWKRQPQDKYCNSWAPARQCWSFGGRVIKAIGYDAGPADSRRAHHIGDDDKYSYWYPLRDWGWDREQCKRQIAAEGLLVPMKSSCFFCPASKPEEIDWLVQHHPNLAERIVAMEANAAGNNTKIEGLWRTSTKKRPGSMTAYIRGKTHLRVVEAA